MTRRRAFAAILAFLLGSWFLAGPLAVQADPPPAVQPAAPPPNNAGDELASWVRPVQYGSAVLLVVAVGLLIFLRLRGRKPSGGNPPGSTGNPPR